MRSQVGACVRGAAFGVALVCACACGGDAGGSFALDQAAAADGGAGVGAAGGSSSSVMRSEPAPRPGTAAAASAGASGAPDRPASDLPAGGSVAAGAGGSADQVVGGAGASGSSGSSAAEPCTRERLKTSVEDYFTALAAHDPSMLPVADDVKFTENGEPLQLGQGLWANAGEVAFKESLYDAESCGTVTQAVVPESGEDLPIALRLKIEAGQITEVETIVVRRGDYLVESNPANMLALAQTPWEERVPEADRQTREQLFAWIDKYFRQFPMGGCNLASDCRRMENGFSLACNVGATCTSAAPSGAPVMEPRIILVDVEAGLAAGFVMFQGRYTDVHMIKYAAGEVLGVHTILGEADSSGWD